MLSPQALEKELYMGLLCSTGGVLEMLHLAGGAGWPWGGWGVAGAFAALQESTGGRGGVPLCEPGGWRMFGGWRKVYVLFMGLVGGTGRAEKCTGGVLPRRGSVWGHCA